MTPVIAAYVSRADEAPASTGENCVHTGDCGYCRQLPHRLRHVRPFHFNFVLVAQLADLRTEHTGCCHPRMPRLRVLNRAGPLLEIDKTERVQRYLFCVQHLCLLRIDGQGPSALMRLRA